MADFIMLTPKPWEHLIREHKNAQLIIPTRYIHYVFVADYCEEEPNEPYGTLICLTQEAAEYDPAGMGSEVYVVESLEDIYDMLKA